MNALVDGPGFDADTLREFPAVKVKVGSPGDVELVAEVRDAIGPQVALRVDANGAWDVDTAIDTIKRLARYDLELVEQPVASLDDLARVRRAVDVPIAADECVRIARRRAPLACARRRRRDRAEATAARRCARRARHRRGGRGPRDRLVDDGDIDRYRGRSSRSRPRCRNCRTRVGWPRSRRSTVDVVRDPLVPEHRRGVIRARLVVPEPDRLAARALTRRRAR